jgi:uncharacterized protein (PEP-CTERM system associated)
MDAREGLNWSFDKLRTNGNVMVSFVLSPLHQISLGLSKPFVVSLSKSFVVSLSKSFVVSLSKSFVVSLSNHLPSKAEGPSQGFPRNRAPRAGTFSILAAMAFTAPAYAVDWRFDAGVGGTATYTDNVNQSPSNTEDALILSVTPNFTLRTEGSRRLNATIQYGLTGVARFGGRDDTDLFHNLNAAGTAELVEDFFFIDASARVSQELLSLSGSPADATINPDNRATAGSYSISPYVKQRVGTFADFQARYTTGGSFFNDSSVNDLISNTFNASLVSGSRFNTLNWGLNYDYRIVADRDSGDTDTSYTYDRLNLSLGYALTRKFRLIGNVGQERIRYDAASAQDIDDTVWSAGFSWTPSRRTSLQATAGERFFGNTYDVSASYRARASTFRVSYTEDVSDISQATLREGTIYLFLCPGPNPGDPPVFVESPFLISPAPGCILLGSQAGLIPSLSNGLYVAKTFRAGVNWGVRRISYSVNAFDIRRSYLLQENAEDRSQGIDVGANYRMDPRTSLFSRLSLEWIEDPATLSNLPVDREDELLRFTLGVNRQFGRDLTGALTYRYTRRDSNDPLAEYTENNLTASANLSF